MNKELIIYLCGFFSLGFAIFHLFFWKIFNWNKELQKVSKHNRGIFQILNIRLIYLLLFTAAVCFFCTEELYTTRLGKAFLLGWSVFWLGRTIEQFIFLRINTPVIHVLTIFFMTGTVLFALPLL